jgi:predicted acetyltransferase
MPATGAGYRALWHYVLNIDLFPIVKYWNYPADDPLRFMVNDGRQIRIKESNDGIWVRLIDVADAMARRTYAAPGELVIGVEDRFCEWNRGSYALTVDDDGSARCRRIDAAADVEVDVSTLGSLYLGGRSAAAMALAGAVSGAAEAIGRLDAMFGGAPAPWCPEIF